MVKAKAKKSTKQQTTKKKAVHKKATVRRKKVVPKDSEPEFMVQVGDPQNLRRSLLESLREVIIFMQSYEKFRKIQEEKIATFNNLKNDIKLLNGLLESKLKKHFPKGKLELIEARKEIPRFDLAEKSEEEPLTEETPAPVQKEPSRAQVSELDELENQLKDIESQLRNVH